MRKILFWIGFIFIGLAAFGGGAWLYSTYRDAGGPASMHTPPVGDSVRPAPAQPVQPPQPEPGTTAAPEPERVDIVSDLARFVIVNCHPAGTLNGGKNGAVTLTMAKLVERYAPETAPASHGAGGPNPGLGVELGPNMLEIAYALAAGRVVEAVAASAADAARAGPAAAKSEAFEPRRTAELVRLSASWLRDLAQCNDPALSDSGQPARSPANRLDCGYARTWFDALLAGQRDKDQTVSKASTLLGQLSARLEQRAEVILQ